MSRNNDIATVATIGAVAIVAGAHKQILRSLGFKKKHHHYHKHYNNYHHNDYKKEADDVLVIDEEVLECIRDGKIDMEKAAKYKGKIKIDMSNLMEKIVFGVLDTSLFENENFATFSQVVGLSSPVVPKATSQEDVINQQNTQQAAQPQSAPAIDPTQAAANGMNIMAQPANNSTPTVIFQNEGSSPVQQNTQQSAQPQNTTQQPQQQASQAPQQ